MKEHGIQYDRHEVQTRLIRMIINMPETKRFELLTKLDRYQHPDVRAHKREPSFIAVDCESVYGNCYTDFIQDISAGGVFIQADGNFFVGQQIKLTFSHPKTEKDVSIGAKIVRVDSKGIGVKFDNFLSDL